MKANCSAAAADARTTTPETDPITCSKGMPICFLMRRYLVARWMGGSPLRWHELSRFADEIQWRYFLRDIEDGITNRVVAGLLAGAPVQRHQPSDE